MKKSARTKNTAEIHKYNNSQRLHRIVRRTAAKGEDAGRKWASLRNHRLDAFV